MPLCWVSLEDCVRLIRSGAGCGGRVCAAAYRAFWTRVDVGAVDVVAGEKEVLGIRGGACCWGFGLRLC